MVSCKALQGLDDEEKLLLDRLVKAGQQHLIEGWSAPGTSLDDKRRLARQLVELDMAYPAGGLANYLSNAKRLLAASREGRNAFDGYKPSIPEGKKLDYGSTTCNNLETLGIAAAGEAAFVLVAGGLGERLGYSGIKLALPAESARDICFLQLYIENILALEAKVNRARSPGSVRKLLPLVIMTSDDTHLRTQQLLRDHGFFGADRWQIHVLKQAKVPCLADGDARLALDDRDPFRVLTKPHGHGDVHSLLYFSGLAEIWHGQGLKWLCFFQDTNGLVFRALPAALGVSAQYGYDMNSLAVPRKAKEAIGGLVKLTNNDTGHNMTINVEYNQLDPLLRETISPEGDVNDASGFSPFPGNINQLVIRLEPYLKQLRRTSGIIAEFVNPKYVDASRTAFKSPTRLECMMQDFPKELPSEAHVGFTVINQVWAAYSPVKNSSADAAAKVAAGLPSHSATTGELDIYAANCRMLRLVGADIADPQPARFNNLDVEEWPHISWHPSFAQTVDELRERLPSPADVHIAARSTLVINRPQLHIKALHLNGTLLVIGVKEAEAVLDGLQVENEGTQWMPLQEGEQATEEEAMRGFKVRHTASRVVPCWEPLLYYLGADEATTKPLQLSGHA